MKHFSGKIVFPGIAFGKAFVLIKSELSVDTSPSTDPEKEWSIFTDAVKTADAQLTVLYEKTLKDYRENPQSELFSAMRYHSYLSYKNTMRPEAVK